MISFLFVGISYSSTTLILIVKTFWTNAQSFVLFKTNDRCSKMIGLLALMKLQCDVSEMHLPNIFPIKAKVLLIQISVSVPENRIAPPTAKAISLTGPPINMNIIPPRIRIQSPDIKLKYREELIPTGQAIMWFWVAWESLGKLRLLIRFNPISHKHEKM